MTPLLEGLPTKAEETPSPHEVRLALLDTNTGFHGLGDSSMSFKELLKMFLKLQFSEFKKFPNSQRYC